MRSQYCVNCTKDAKFVSTCVFEWSCNLYPIKVPRFDLYSKQDEAEEESLTEEDTQALAAVVEARHRRHSQPKESTSKSKNLYSSIY